MTDADKALRIIEAIRGLANAGRCVKFVEDWGGNSLTIYVDHTHTHVGLSDGTPSEMIDELLAAVTHSDYAGFVDARKH
jgi:hypothetical protein